VFNKVAHSHLRDAATPKDLHHIPCRILAAPHAVHLQKGDLAGKFGKSINHTDILGARSHLLW
jgi:hypothetical protein